MDERSAAVAVTAKMALMDGEIGNPERALLEELLGTGPIVDEVVEYARTVPLKDLLTRVNRYEDRFFVTYRAYFMAAADGTLDIAELRIFNRLVREFAIASGDRDLIVETHARLTAEKPADPDPRVMELYRASSFFEQDG